MIRPFIPKDEEDVGYYFYDLNAKINYDFGQKNRLYLSGYFGSDVLNIKTIGTSESTKAGISWGNQTSTLRWNHLFNERLFMNSSYIFSNYQFGVFASQFITQQGKLNEYTEQYNSRIKDFGLKIDFDYLPNPTH